MNEFRVWIRTKLRSSNGIKSCFLCFYILTYSLNISRLPPQSTVCKEELRKYFSYFSFVKSVRKEIFLFACQACLFFKSLLVLMGTSDEADEEPVVYLLSSRNVLWETEI